MNSFIPLLYKESTHAELHHKNLQTFWDGHKKLVTVVSELGGIGSEILAFPLLLKRSVCRCTDVS